MIKDHSETKADLICEECGEPINQNQMDNKPIYCEFCGSQYNSEDLQHPEESQPEQERVRFSYTTEELGQELRNLTYQKIYELLKANFSIMRHLKHQEKLKQSQIVKLAKKVRRTLVFLSLPSNRADLLTKTSKKKIENYFEEFQASLKKKKKNQSNYMPYLTNNIKFIYDLINGDYEFSTLAKYNQKALKKLKKKYGFKVNAKTQNSFSYSLSVLICRKIYKIITAQGQVLDLKQKKNELTNQYTLNTAKDITALVLSNEFKHNFSKAYKRLKEDLEIDWVYRESFIEYVCSLIRLVYKLAYNNGYSSRLGGFQKLIAEDLKKSRFFEDDSNFTPCFTLNLTLILSRIIHYLLDSSQNLPPLQSDHRKLNHTDNLRVANEILDEILADNKIKSEFLKEFYNLSLEEFQKEYENLNTKLKADMLYKENFLTFLKNLINSVYKITHTKSKKSKHSKIELVIIKDLANFNFNWEPSKKGNTINDTLKEKFEPKKSKYSYKEIRRIRILRNKARIILNIHNGKYGNKCRDCETTIVMLPAFDLHHPNRDLKTGEIKFEGNWKKILKQLEKENTVPLCRNCHLKKQAKFYNKYKDIIDKENEFELSLNGIENKIYQYLYKFGFNYQKAYQIKSWIQKRIVIKRLYNGRCIGCGETNLSSLIFHHRNINKKTFPKYDALRYTKIVKIEKKLIKDDSICLCGNCHRMVGAPYFENNCKVIMGEDISHEIKNFYNSLNKKIKSFRFPEKILEQYPLIETEQIEIGHKSPIYKLNPKEKRIKREIMDYNWETVSKDWILPSGELLDPTKECSLENPLYKHKEWLKTVYNNKKWGLSDMKIARITNFSQTKINNWRRKHQIKNHLPKIIL